MKSKAIVAGASLLVFAALAAGGWWFFVVKPAADEAERLAAEVTEVQQRVMDVLKDPDSAKFRGVKFFRRSGAGCGEVNAKNSMGGYVGYTWFVAFKDGEVRLEPREASATASVEELVDAAAKRRGFLMLVEANCTDGPPDPQQGAR